MSDFGARFRERITPAQDFVLRKVGVTTGTINGNDMSAADFGPPLVSHFSSNPMCLELERTWDSNNPGPPYHEGHGFTNVKVKLHDHLVLGSGVYRTRPDWSYGGPAGTYYGYKYTGGFCNPAFTGDFTSLAEYQSVGFANGGGHLATNPQDLSGLGPEAFRRLRPKLEHAGAAQFLAEIRDVPRMLQTTSKLFHMTWKDLGGKGRSSIMTPKKAADQFINHQFGWLPFVKDLLDFDKVYQNSKKFIKRHTEHNDKWERRYTVLSSPESNTIIGQGNGWGVWPAGNTISAMFGKGDGGAQISPTYTTRLEKHQRVWASGLFKIYRPEFDSSLSGYDSTWNSVQQQLMLYGARINPSVLYKITPWSWLIDWFTNVGTNIDNASAIAQDAVASKNLFLMSHSQSLITFEQVAPFWEGTRTMKWAREVELKQRGEGGPYGLGWSSQNLSTRQLAILTALAITHRP